MLKMLGLASQFEYWVPVVTVPEGRLEVIKLRNEKTHRSATRPGGILGRFPYGEANAGSILDKPVSTRPKP